MTAYFRNGGNGTLAFPGFKFIKESAGEKPIAVCTEVHQYRFTKPRSDIVSYIVVGENETISWEEFEQGIRWMFALDSDGKIWYNVHGKGEAVTYDKWELYPMTHDYFNKKISMGCLVYYSNGKEYRGFVVGTRRISDSTYNVDILRELVNYKISTNTYDCGYESTPTVYTDVSNYTCTVDLFKRGSIGTTGIDGWVHTARAGLKVKFDFAGLDAGSVRFDDIKCLAYIRDGSIHNILDITRVDEGVYEYVLHLDSNVEGFWFCTRVTGKKLNVDMTNLRV